MSRTRTRQPHPGFAATAAAVLLLVLVSTAIRPASATSAASTADPTGDAIDRFVRDWQRANGVPGLAVAVTRGPDVVHLQGYGDDGRGPITADTKFLVASLSKSFTALAVLQLVEAGRVDLDAAVRAYLPDFRVADPVASQRITVRMLLHQTGGLADAGYPELTLPQPTTLAERVADLRRARLVDEPGTHFHYHNPNYAVLARLVEVVTGQSFAAVLRQRIFGPLDMTRTTSIVTAQQTATGAPELTRGHVLAFGVPFGRAELDGFIGGSGGVVSTARDLANWLILHADQGQFQGRRLLDAAGIRLMQTPPAGVDSTYAMGWASMPDRPGAVEHTGVLSTFSAEQGLLPDERIGIAFLADTYHGLVQSEGLMSGLVAIAEGRSAPEVGIGARGIGAALALAAAGVTVLGGWRLRRVRRWTARRRGHPWRTAIGVVLPFVPGVIALLTPSLVARFADRVFGWQVLFLSMPDVLGTLVLAGVLGAALGMARIVLLVRGRGHTTVDQEVVGS